MGQTVKDYWSSGIVPQDAAAACGTVEKQDTVGNFVVRGRLKPDQTPNAMIKFWAANPIDQRDSFVGSGLPFPNAEIAYENSPNTGSVRAVNGEYTLRLYFPNSFYTDLGRTLIPPHVLIKVCGDDHSDIETVILGASPKDRVLTSRNDSYTRSSFKDRTWDVRDVSRFL